jgi:glycosyltransferase involved in cell wall biosynthesis
MNIVYIENVRIPSERAHAYQITQTCMWLGKAGHQVTLVNPDRAKGAPDVFTAFRLPPGIFTHVTLPGWDPLTLVSKWKKLQPIAYALQRAAFVRKARAWAKTVKADVWYTRDVAMVDALCDTIPGPWILEVHDAPDSSPVRWERVKDRIAGFVGISQGVKDKLVSLGIPAERVHVAPDGYDPKLFTAVPGDRAALRKELGVPADAFVMLYTGSLYPWKGVDLVAEAWDRTPAHCHLMIVGGPTGDADRVRSVIRAGAASRVHLYPSMERDAVVRLYAAADAGLLSSSPKHEIGRSYTSPLKLFEYLAGGLPILASDVPSSHEVLDHQVARFYEPTEEGLVQTLTAMAQDTAWCAAAHALAPSFVAPYTWESRTKQIVEWVAATIATPPNPVRRGSILILTQKLNEDDFDLWFFVAWVNTFTRYFEKVFVVCLEERAHPNLSPDVQVMSLGKERGVGKIGRVWNLWRYLWRTLPKVDGAFIHMNQVYAILGWPFYVLFGKKRAIWYCHRTIAWDLKLAVRLVNGVFTAADSTFPYPTAKKIITGHGIDTDFYRPIPDVRHEGPFTLLSLARITPTKNQKLMCEAMNVLRERGRTDVALHIYSEPMLPSDVKYLESLKAFVASHGLEESVRFLGRVKNADMPMVYNQHDLFLNFARTTGIDKAVLEAMACGLNVLTSNATFKEMLPARHFVENPSPEELATAIESFLAERRVNEELRSIVIRDHNLDKLIRQFHAFYIPPSAR